MAGVAPTLSVVIITLNEEKNIVDCIKSVGDVTEVVVVDSGSTDRTVELAAMAGAKVVQHPMQDFSSQRNFADSLATGDWLLSIDADERVTPELTSEVAAAIQADSYPAFLVPELNVVFGKPLRHGGWYPQYHLRLLRRGSGAWTGDVMERVLVRGGPPGRLASPIVHYGHPDVETFVSKLNRYSALEAHRMKSRSRIELAVRAVVEPVPYFLYKYVVQAGFLDGWRGLAVAILLSYYRSMLYIKALELGDSVPAVRVEG